MLTILSCASGRADLLAKHLESLAADRIACDSQYSVGIWGAQSKIVPILEGHRRRFAQLDITSVKDDCYWPLPRAYNAALSKAKGDRAIIIGSEIIIQPGLLEWANDRPDKDTIWCFSVHRGSRDWIIGPGRRVGLPYCMVLDTLALKIIHGWREAFCGGVCYDDNDLSARLLMFGQTFRWSDKFDVIHQDHPAYGRNRDAHTVINRKIWEAGFLVRLPKTSQLWPVIWDNDDPPAPPADDDIEGSMAKQGQVAMLLRSCGYPNIGDYHDPEIMHGPDFRLRLRV